MQSKKDENCTHKIDAVIYDLSTTKVNGKTKVSPVYEYTYRYMTFRIKGDHPVDSDVYDIGDEVEIYIDPMFPQRMYDPKSEKESKTKDIFRIATILFMPLVFFIAITIIIVKSRKSLKNNTHSIPRREPDFRNFGNDAPQYGNSNRDYRKTNRDSDRDYRNTSSQRNDYNSYDDSYKFEDTSACVDEVSVYDESDGYQ